MVNFMKCLFSMLCTLVLLSSNISVIAYVPDEVNAMKVTADSLKSIQMYKEAIPYYDSLLTKNGKQFDILKAKGECLAQIGEISSAILVYKSALEIDSLDAYLWKQIGDAYAFGNIPSSAIKSYARSISINPKLSYA